MTAPATVPRSQPRVSTADPDPRQPHNAPGGRARAARDARRLAEHNPKVRAGHRRLRTRLWPYIWGGDLPTLLTAPVIYSLVLPFVLLDGWVSLYQAICFRAWGIAPVQRRAFFALDRHRLAYLNGVEKLNCLFCSYVNGLIAFVREVAARTEQYWCPIHHARRTRHPHDRYAAFAPYGDPAAYRDVLGRLRAQLKK